MERGSLDAEVSCSRMEGTGRVKVQVMLHWEISVDLLS